MKPDTKALKKLKRKYSKNPDDRGVALVKRLSLSYSPGCLVVWVLRKYFVKTDYKASRESIKFFQLSNRAYGAGKRLRAQRLLMIALRLLGDRLPQSYISLLNSAVVTTLRDSTKRSSFSSSILSATKEVPVEIFDASSWYQLSRGLFSLGYFRAAWVARENSLDLSISESLASDASATTLQRGIEAHLERRNFSEADAAIRHSTSKISADRISEFGEYLAMMQRDLPKSQSNAINYNVIGEKIFRELVGNNTVALVGPGTPHGEFGEEIDSSETIIRIKFIESQGEAFQKSFGRRTDAIYLGGDAAFESLSIQITEKVIGLTFPSDVKVIVATRTSFEKIGQIPIYFFIGEGCLYRTTSTAGVRLILEVIRYRPSEVVIYGFDFYTTLHPYNKEMSALYEDSPWQFGHSNDFVADGVYFKFARARDFAGHDPVSNFCFAQNLYKAGLFEIEPYGKSILELTPYQYVERLEEMLGGW